MGLMMAVLRSGKEKEKDVNGFYKLEYKINRMNISHEILSDSEREM